MKKLLIVSPNFPPANAVDMHRIRMSLPYFAGLGWEPVVLSVRNEDSPYPADELLSGSVPSLTRVIRVPVLNIPAINSLGIRALWPMYRQGSMLLKKEKFHLVYFSTTMFPLPLLGHYWKKLSGVPYVIDMQDPWYSTYYDNKPAAERPPKHWLSSRVHRYTEPLAMKSVDGLISVSAKYIELLESRYARIKELPSAVIPFAASYRDLEIAGRIPASDLLFDPNDGLIHLVYAGRVGKVMQRSLRQLFTAFRSLLRSEPDHYSGIRFHFIGTDYASGEQARESVLPIAAEFGLEHLVRERTQRIPFYLALAHASKAAGTIIPGSDDPGYTASKIYPYLLAERPLMGIFHAESPVVKILKNYRPDALSILGEPAGYTERLLKIFLQKASAGRKEQNLKPVWDAEAMSRQQVELFNRIV